MAYIGNSPSNIQRGRRAVYEFTATAGQTVFTGVDNNGLTLDLLEYNENDVYLNGSRLVLNDDYTVSGDTLTLLSGAALSDILVIVTQDEVANAGSYTKAESDSRYINYDGDIVNGNLQIVGDITAQDITGNVLSAGTSNPPYAAAAPSEYIEINDGSITKLFSFIDENGVAVIQASKWDGTNPGRNISFRNQQGTNGYAAESMFISSTGNVGIGTASPSSVLHLASSSASVSPYLTLQNTNTGAYGAGISFRSYGAYEFGDYETARINTLSGIDDGYLVFSTSNNNVMTEAMRIDSTGNILVGTTNADVGGSVTGIRLLQSGAIFTSTDETATLFSQPLYADRRGTNNEGDILALGLGGYLKSSIGVIGTNSSSDNGGITFNTIANNATKTERMRVTANGNVGIGTSSPSSLVDIEGSGATVTIADTGDNYNLNDEQSSIHLSGRWYSGTVDPGQDDYSDARIVLRKDNTDGYGGSALAFETSDTGSGGLTEKMRISSNGSFDVVDHHWLNTVSAYRISTGTQNRNITLHNPNGEYYVIFHLVGLWPYAGSGYGTTIIEVAGFGSENRYSVIRNNSYGAGSPTSVSVSASGGNLVLTVNYNSVYRFACMTKQIYGSKDSYVSIDGTNG